MILTPELIIALTGLFTAGVALFGQWRSSKIQARQDEVQLLGREVGRLHARVEELENENKALHQENYELRDKNLHLTVRVSQLEDALAKMGKI